MLQATQHLTVSPAPPSLCRCWALCQECPPAPAPNSVHLNKGTLDKAWSDPPCRSPLLPPLSSHHQAELLRHDHRPLCTVIMFPWLPGPPGREPPQVEISHPSGPAFLKSLQMISVTLQVTGSRAPQVPVPARGITAQQTRVLTRGHHQGSSRLHWLNVQTKERRTILELLKPPNRRATSEPAPNSASE